MTFLLEKYEERLGILLNISVRSRKRMNGILGKALFVV